MGMTISKPYRFIVLSEDIEEVKKMREYNNQVIPNKSTAIAVDTNEQFIFQDGKWRKMSIDELRQECEYCYREVDASGLEAFRCTNKTVNMETSWCRPKNANEPCSICEYCKPREEMGMSIDESTEVLKEHLRILNVDKGIEFWKEIEALEMALDTIQKYQKIEQIYKEWFTDKGHTSAEAYTRIGEILKDGNVD